MNLSSCTYSWYPPSPPTDLHPLPTPTPQPVPPRSDPQAPQATGLPSSRPPLLLTVESTTPASSSARFLSLRPTDHDGLPKRVFPVQLGCLAELPEDRLAAT